MKVRIPFNERFKEPLLNDVKTWTSRNKSYGQAGDTFTVFGCEFEILKIEKRLLYDVAYNHWKEEGFNSFNDFKTFWERIHFRKGFMSKHMVHVHIFKRVHRQTERKIAATMLFPITWLMKKLNAISKTG